jgi:hypothetical protein
MQSHVAFRTRYSLRPLMKPIRISKNRKQGLVGQVVVCYRQMTRQPREMGLISCLFADRAHLLIPLGDINLGFHSPMPDILTRCPKTGQTIKTGLTTEMIEIDSLPRVPIPVWCPLCSSTHSWTSLTAWIANQTRNQTAAE